MKKKKICFLVSNDLTADPRVLKQLYSSSKAGYKSYALGFRYITPNDHLGSVEKGVNWQIMRGGYSFSPLVSKKKRLLCYSLLEIASISRTKIINFLIVAKYKTIQTIFLTRQWIIDFLIKTKRQIRILQIINLRNFRQNNITKDKSRPHEDKNNTGYLNKSTAIIDKNPKKGFIQRFTVFLIGILLNCLECFFSYLDLYKYYKTMNTFFIEKGMKIKPDIVHANDLDTLLAGYIIKKKTGAKLVYDAHEVWTQQGLLLPSKVVYIYSRIEKYLIKKIDAFVSVNHSIIKEIEKIYNYKFSVPKVVVYNAPLYKKIKPENKKKKKYIVLYQGRYCFDRGLEELAESARYLKDNIEINFVAMGDPPTKERLTKICNKYRLHNRLKFLEPVPMDKMVKAASYADIGVISYKPTNVNNKFCSPNKLFEYMMAGLALAVSDLPELRKIIKENKNGLSFNPYNPKSIAQILNNLVENPKKLKQMKFNSLLAAKKYNWGNEEKKLFKLYNKLLEG